MTARTRQAPETESRAIGEITDGRRLGLLEQGQARLESDFVSLRDDFGEMRGDIRALRGEISSVVDELRRGYRPQYSVWAAIAGVFLVIIGAFFAPYIATINDVSAKVSDHHALEGHQNSLTRIGVMESRFASLQRDLRDDLDSLEARLSRARDDGDRVLRAEIETLLWRRRAEESGWIGRSMGDG